MGIDAVYITLSSEEKFGICMEAGEWSALGDHRQPWDATAGEVFKLICAYKIDQHCHSGLKRASARFCPQCGWSLTEQAEQQMWEDFRAILAEALNRAPHQITKDSFLIRDLGMS